MDPGFYEDLAGRLYGLLIGLEGRLNCDDAGIIHQFIDARHYGLALEEIARTLAHRTIAITARERADMLALADQVDALAQVNRTPLKGDLVREWMAYGQRLLRGPGRAAVRPGDQAQ
jgi:hypothetical protein